MGFYGDREECRLVMFLWKIDLFIILIWLFSLFIFLAICNELIYSFLVPVKMGFYDDRVVSSPNVSLENRFII